MTYPLAVHAYIRLRDMTTKAAMGYTMESGHPARNPVIVNPVTCTVRSLEFNNVRRYPEPVVQPVGRVS